ELFERGATVRIIALSEPSSMSEDAAAHFRVLEKVAEQTGSDRLSIRLYESASEIPAADIHVDALLGTGLAAPLREPILSLVDHINSLPGTRVAVDIPSGLHTDFGRPLGNAIRAHLTCTMAARKTGHHMNEGPDLCGTVEVVPIGIPDHVLREALRSHGRGCAWMCTDDAIRSWLPIRGSDAHKYSVGLALVVAGSAGMTGAPAMAATAAARVGAGYVMCACDRRIESTLAAKLTEVTTISLPAGPEGLEPAESLKAIEPHLERAKGLLLGCGLGQSTGTQEFVRTYLARNDRPVVIDADGLNALVGHADLVARHSKGRWILTPHMGEFKRLVGDDLDGSGLDPDDRVSLAQYFARRWNCVLILKGLPSVVAASDGRAWINATGSSALATAGTGDVLAGLCAGSLAQGLPPDHAAAAALHIGGAAADRFISSRAGRSMQATDLIEEIPYVLKERFELE